MATIFEMKDQTQNPPKKRPNAKKIFTKVQTSKFQKKKKSDQSVILNEQSHVFGP